MFRGQHHLHVRKRIHEKHEPYPHPDKWKNLMDRMVYVVGILGPLMVIPQVYNIWVLGDAAGVSVMTWTAFTLITLFWIAYALMHRSKPLIINYVGWFIMNALVVAGVLFL